MPTDIETNFVCIFYEIIGVTHFYVLEQFLFSQDLKWQLKGMKINLENLLLQL